MGSLTVNRKKLKKFTIDTRPIMEKYLSRVDAELSDYTFAANFIWLANSSGFYAVINKCFCLFVMTGGELTMLLPPLGKKKNITDAIIKCFEIMNENNSSHYYSRIDYVQGSMVEEFIQDADEAQSMFEMLESYIVEKKLVDYIYEVEALIGLRGNSYHTKRTEINKFVKSYPDYKIEELDSIKHKVEIMNLFNKWTSDRVRYMPKEEAEVYLEGIHQERSAVKQMLKHYAELSLLGIVIYINGELKGFTVGERIRLDTATVIIEKTDFEILGCAQFIFREFSKILKDHYKITYINVGDDMGFENLRKVKMSYRPSKLVAKYTIYQK
ncbi:ribonuclease HII [Sulfurimonas hongkongensis]|uniref:Ribonuclease HII n=1 Tax=Sulfurimonas hongkongensis TaxID=1172190 RepID=T0JFF0_9BACT|nr:phosphatidylglycerol lysyltransferase domain-containing protein [Sulfurimonas hongkongensis]EQB35592.1 ribonuclease HII [Sulfurimonas hongkongensis]